MTDPDPQQWQARAMRAVRLARDLQPSLFDPAAGAAARDDGIARSYDNRSDEWQALAMRAVRLAAERHERFTTDEVIEVLEGELEAPPEELRGLGAVMKRAARLGWIVPTGVYEPSKIARRHRGPKAVWRSTLWRGDQ